MRKWMIGIGTGILVPAAVVVATLGAERDEGRARVEAAGRHSLGRIGRIGWIGWIGWKELNGPVTIRSYFPAPPALPALPALPAR
jgi:hypothetical protein